MREHIQSVSLDGQHVRLTTRDRLPIERRVLALAAAVRLFERYAVLDRLTLAAGDLEVVVSRDDVSRLLGPEGFAAVKDRARYRQILSRGVPPEEAQA